VRVLEIRTCLAVTADLLISTDAVPDLPVCCNGDTGVGGWGGWFGG